jgi:hypothetical protein
MKFKIIFTCNMENSNLINRLSALKQKDKFSEGEWNRRGLNPSGVECCRQLDLLFNAVLVDLIEGVGSSSDLKQILSHHLSGFVKSEYDAEEREFIADLFSNVAFIVDVDFAFTLNRWIYGSIVAIIMKIFSLFKRPAVIVDTLSQECTNCNALLETFILERGNDIPDLCWDIIQCDSCKEFNLLNKGPHIRQLRFGNYRWIEQLSKSEFNEEQATIRLEQIKYFRKK